MTATVRGTELRVDVLSGLHNRLATDDGSVRVNAGRDSVYVEDGEEVDIRYGQRLTVRQQVSAAGGEPFTPMTGGEEQ
jgi:hypothetical protein